LPGHLSLFDTRLIWLGGRSLEYRFARRRRRSLGITVDASGLAVCAPLRAPFREIEAFLRDKERWILAKLEEWSRVPRPAQVAVATGETLPVFGERLVLDVREGGRSVRRDAGRLVVCAPDAPRAVGALVGWLKTQALETLTPRAEHFAARLGLPPPRVALSAARGQWGVCVEGGAIRLNWRLVHLAPRLADYVAAHEAAHLVEMNHSKRFWDLVASLYPAWREAREELELAGAAIPLIKGA
jgi:predicted metal-dependent hydrolase